MTLAQTLTHEMHVRSAVLSVTESRACPMHATHLLRGRGPDPRKYSSLMLLCGPNAASDDCDLPPPRPAAFKMPCAMRCAETTTTTSNCERACWGEPCDETRAVGTAGAGLGGGRALRRHV
eukprot:3938845-Rhodomonas_salina.3